MRQGQYVDGLWTYSVPWAVYLLKTGRPGVRRAELRHRWRRRRASRASRTAAHAIAADRTGPMGTMEATNDIDTQGYWTTDDFEALLGLAAYRYIASTLGDTAEAVVGIDAVRQPPRRDQRRARPDDQPATTSTTCPARSLQPNTANRCNNPEDANWTSPIGNWAWEGSLFGATVSGPGLTLIDATYDYGFGRLRGRAPAGHDRRASRATTTRAPTTPRRAPPGWPARATETRASWTTSS